MKLRIDRTQRLGVVEDLPYAKAIGDAELRELVYDAWAMSLSSSGFDRINDMPCSGGPGGPRVEGQRSGGPSQWSGPDRRVHSAGAHRRGGPFPGRPGRGDSRRVVPRPWQGMGVRPRQPREMERPSDHRLAVPAPPVVRGSSSPLRPACLSRSPTSPALTRPKGSTSRGASPAR